MDQFGADNRNIESSLRDRVASSDVFVLVLDERFGSRSLDGTFFTELEYNLALGLSLPILPYIRKIHPKPTNRKVPNRETKELRAFCQRLRAKHVVFEWSEQRALLKCVVKDVEDIAASSGRSGLVPAEGVIQPFAEKLPKFIWNQPLLDSWACKLADLSADTIKTIAEGALADPLPTAIYYGQVVDWLHTTVWPKSDDEQEALAICTNKEWKDPKTHSYFQA
jgi:hypothetical protein